MTVEVIGSGSAGNCYLLSNEDEALIIELGVRFDKVKKALNFNLSKVVGCIVSHEHGDHSSAIPAAIASGLNVYATAGTIKMTGINSHRLKSVDKNKAFVLGNFKIMPFKVMHDAADPVGFIIQHPESGNILFITDTYYVHERFENLNNIIVEANYCEEIINEKLKQDKRFLRDRVLQSHMSINTCLGLLKANDLSRVNNIMLIHLSDNNSDEAAFKQKVSELTGKTVHVASNGMKVEFNKNPF